MSCPKCEPKRSRRLYWVMAIVAVVLAFAALAERSRPKQPAHVSVSQKAPLQGADDPQTQAFEEELSRAFPADAPRAVATRSFELRAAPASVPQFDGRALDVWAYNGQVPGPVLRVRLGEQLEVHLRNDLPQPTTVHWHGVRVPNAMDGVPGVTQAPVPPGGEFTYRFVPKDAGTFWFHPHVRGAEQVERGLYGVLVVDDQEPLPYSRDEVWVLDDWRLGSDGQLDPRFVTRHDLAHDGRWGQVITVNGDSAQQMTVRPGERLRLRLANTSNARVYQPDFGELDAQVIAVDGMYTYQPLASKGFELAPGNRLDFDVRVPADAAGHSFAIVDRFTRNPATLATLKVEGTAVEPPRFAAPSNRNVPEWPAATSRKVDQIYVLNAQLGGEYGIQWTINGRPWGEHEATQLAAGKWVRVRFQNDSARLHPMHIHGQFFQVIAPDSASVNERYFRDTVLLHPRETIDVGMVPIDWGRWMMHCHILEHAEAGMMTEIDVAQQKPFD